MTYVWFVAHRYLKGQHKGRVFITIAGVAIGVSALIVVNSIMNGFITECYQRLVGFEGSIVLWFSDESDRVDSQIWMERLESRKEVHAVAPRISYGGVVLQKFDFENRKRRMARARIQGIEPPREDRISRLSSYVLAGDLNDLAAKERATNMPATGPIDPFEVPPERIPLFLGSVLVEELFFPGGELETTDWIAEFESRVLGATLTIVMRDIERGPAGLVPRFFEAEVRGAIKIGLADYDRWNAYTSLEGGRIVNGVGPEAMSNFAIRLEDPSPDATEAAATAITRWASEEHHVIVHCSTWNDENEYLERFFNIQKFAMTSILLLVVLVAMFGIMSTLVMTVLEKTREVGTLMSLGARKGDVTRIFVIHGFLVGVYGTLIGVAGGLLVCKAIDILNIRFPGSREFPLLDYLPVDVQWQEVVIVSAVSLLASTLAGVYPAWKAARLRPVEALARE